MTTRMYRKAVLAVSLGLGLSFASQAYAAEITLYAVVDQQAQPPQVTVQAVFPSPDAPVPKGVVVGSNFFDVTEILFLNGYTVSNPIAAAGGSPPEKSADARTTAPRSTGNLNRFQAVLLTPTGEIGIIRNLFHSEVFPPHELIMIGVLNPQAPDFAVLAVMTSTGALMPVLGDADVPAATQILVNAGYVSIQPNEELTKRLDQIQAEQPSSLQVATLPQGDIGFLRSMSRPPDPGLPGNPPLEVLLTGVADLANQVILTTSVLKRTGFSLPQLTGKFLDDTRILKLLGFAGPRTFLVANSPDIGSIPAPPPARELSVVITAAGEIAVVRSFFRPALVLPK